ncbi:MAG: ABC transporter permease [Nitrososphaerales archaeon]|jgi:ABC-2 type transport system permease protein
MESPIEFGKVWAMARRDMSAWGTYKTQAVLSILSGVLGIVTWGLSSTYVNRPVPQYNTDYVSFLIVGILISSLILPLQSGVQSRINPFTLETILMAGLKTPTFILGTVIWPYVFSVLMFIPQLIIGTTYFHAHLNVNPISFVLSLLISSSVIFSLAMISTGFRIVTKTSDPVTWALGVAGALFSGATFPIQHLNDFVPGLSNVSWLLPQTWIYHIVRLATLENASILDPSVATAFVVAAIFGAVLLPISFLVFRWGLNRAKRDGSLGHF